MIAQKKKFMSVLFTVVIMLTTSSVAVNAAQSFPPGIQPFWINTSDMVVGLSITDGKAVLSASVDGYSGTTKITAVAVLERKNSDGTYTEIERWDNISADNWYLDWGSTRYVTKGYTYRFTFSATVYKNGYGEPISGSKSATA